MNRYRIARVLKIATVAALAFGAIGFVVMSLWNALAPAAFGGHVIGFWQALGLFVLARLLVGSLRRGGGRGHWRHRMQARWESMSDDERERFRQRLSQRCGGPRADKSGGMPA